VATAQLQLPAQIATKADVVGVLRNLDDVIDASVENGVRQHEGVDFVSRPDVTSNLATLVGDNGIEVTAEALKALRVWLKHILDKAPLVRFVFASDPNPEFLAKLVTWIRAETGQFILVRYSVQPTIAAGCIMYTPTHRYDFSLRQRLLGSGQVFAAQLEAVMAQAQTRTQVQGVGSG
jgi:hypothetical protein